MLCIQIPYSAASNTAGVTARCVLGKSGLTAGARIQGATLTPTEDVSADASNYRTFTLKANGVSIATKNTKTGEGGAQTAGTPVELTVTSTHLDAGDVLSFENAESGTGPACSGFLTVFYVHEADS